MTIGKSIVQHICINWSYRNRGKVARNHTKIKQKKHVLILSTRLCIFKKDSFTITSGNRYPPRKKIALKLDMSTILQYSLRKKNTKIIPLCSVKKPATNSLSASGRSKGVRFVSANLDKKKIRKTGKRGTINQTLCCTVITLIK
jgi:hypothetical protein